MSWSLPFWNMSTTKNSTPLWQSKGAIFYQYFRRKRIGVRYRVGFLVKYIIFHTCRFVNPCLGFPDLNTLFIPCCQWLLWQQVYYSLFCPDCISSFMSVYKYSKYRLSVIWLIILIICLLRFMLNIPFLFFCTACPVSMLLCAHVVARTVFFIIKWHVLHYA